MQRKQWNIRGGVDMETRRKLRAYAAAHGLTIAQALQLLVERAIAAENTQELKQSGTKRLTTETRTLGITVTGDVDL